MTHDMLRRSDVQSTADLLSFAQQQIGCPKPIGTVRRGVTMRRIKDEMSEQRWTWDHLTAAVAYMKSRGIRPRSFDYVFYHVEPAVKNGHLTRPSVSTWDDLEAAVSAAIYTETDDEWKRRLMSARGAALQQVYDKWKAERHG